MPLHFPSILKGQWRFNGLSFHYHHPSMCLLSVSPCIKTIQRKNDVRTSLRILNSYRSNYLLLYLFLGTSTILVMTTMVVDNMQDKWMNKRGNGPGGYVTFLYIIMSTYLLICFRYYNKWQAGMMNDWQKWQTTRGMGVQMTCNPGTCFFFSFLY